MKKEKSKLLLSVAIVVSTLLISSCKKDTTTTTSSSTIPSSEIVKAQDAESQDAIADKVDNDVDNDIETVQANGFATGSLKSAAIQSVDVKVDSFLKSWPKVITLTYNWSDTINGEHITKTGTITITMDTTIGAHKYGWESHFKRSIEFKNFMVTTDSTSVTINGFRTVTRNSTPKSLVNGLAEISFQANDSITTKDLTFTLKNIKSDTNISESFTRNVAKLRTITTYFKGTLVGKKYKYKSELLKDSIVWTGNITGVNAKNENYTREITTPLVMIFSHYWPHNAIMSSGVITQTIGTSVVTFTYTSDCVATGCKTKVTIEKDGKTKVIERKYARKLVKWW